MILDAQLQFSSAQAVTAAAASTNKIDVGEARNLGVGKDLYVLVTVDVAMTDGSSDSTLDVWLYGDSSSSFTPDGKQLLFTIPAVSAIGAGPFYAKISPSMVAGVLAGNYEWLELYFDPQNGSLSTGSFSGYITTDIAAFTAYAKGYTIS